MPVSGWRLGFPLSIITSVLTCRPLKGELIMSDVSRRSFIQGAGAVGLAVATATPAAALAQEETDQKAKLEATMGDSAGQQIEYASATPENRWQSEAGAAWRTAPDPIDDADITDGGTYDFVIVGGGQSGTWAAKSLAENGLSVAVIEQQAEDSMQYIGGEVGTINNPWALEHGADEIDPLDFMREVCRRNEARGNQAFIRDYVENSGEILQKVVEEMGDEWMEANSHVGSCPHDDRMVFNPSGFKYYTGTIIFRPPEMIREAWAWNDVMHQMNADAQQAGAAWVWENHADYLEKDADGRVTAVIAHNVNDSSYQRITASRGVVLCGGDFNGNTDMLRDINDEYRHLAESLGDIELASPLPIFYSRDGSAIAMGVWAGGHIEVGPRAGMNTGEVAISAPWGPGALLLNQNGERFCDECAGGTEGAGYLAPRQPKGSIVSIVDANWEEIPYTMPPAHGAVDIAHANNWPMIVDAMSKVKPGTEPTDVSDQNDTYSVYCADTIEDLVDVLGVWDDDQKATAIEQIKRYQELAGAGKDTDYAKDERILAINALDTPPFYATVSSSSAFAAGLCQTTGLDVDNEHRVVDFDRKPIPGLYALGNASGNRFIVQYATPLSGMSLGFCMTEGTLFGQRVASGEIE